MENITVEKIYNAPVQTVWKAITDRAQMKQWYFDFPSEFKPEVGAQFDWEAGGPEGEKWLHRGKILEVIENKKLSHSWEYPGYSGKSTVTWELTPVDENKTKLVLTHMFNIPFDKNVKAFDRSNFVAGWTHIVTISLAEFLEKR